VIDKGVKDAIARGVAPYDELEMLTRKERTDFLAGNLIF
jgi:hypothetical protein